MQEWHSAPPLPSPPLPRCALLLVLCLRIVMVVGVLHPTHLSAWRPPWTKRQEMHVRGDAGAGGDFETRQRCRSMHGQNGRALFVSCPKSTIEPVRGRDGRGHRKKEDEPTRRWDSSSNKIGSPKGSFRSSFLSGRRHGHCDCTSSPSRLPASSFVRFIWCSSICPTT